MRKKHQGDKKHLNQGDANDKKIYMSYLELEYSKNATHRRLHTDLALYSNSQEKISPNPVYVRECKLESENIAYKKKVKRDFGGAVEVSGLFREALYTCNNNVSQRQVAKPQFDNLISYFNKSSFDYTSLLNKREAFLAKISDKNTTWPNGRYLTGYAEVGKSFWILSSLILIVPAVIALALIVICLYKQKSLSCCNKKDGYDSGDETTPITNASKNVSYRI